MPPPFDNRTARYPWFMKYLLYALNTDFDAFTVDNKDRRALEHFIDRESRKANRPVRVSEYLLEKRLKDNGTVKPEFIGKGDYAKQYYLLLWLYNICAVLELNSKLQDAAKKDMEAWLCQYHSNE